MKIHLVGLLAGMCFSAAAQPVAFPGAEGYGKYKVGGRGVRWNGLNPADASDASRYTLHDNYTNIEVYWESLLR